MQKLGGMGGVLGMLPGVAKIKGQINEAGLDKSLVHQRAIIGSMTPQERRNPKVLDARRKRRIAAGSGTKVEEINKLIKMHRQMADMMKQMGQQGRHAQQVPRPHGCRSERSRDGGRCRTNSRKLDPKALEQLPAELRDALPTGGGAAPKGLPGLGMPKGLPGLGGGLPMDFRARRRVSEIPGLSRKEEVRRDG